MSHETGKSPSYCIKCLRHSDF